MTIGDFIKEYRKTHGCSMEEFARKTGLSKAYVSILERNYNPSTGKAAIPSLDTIKRVSTATGADFNYLIETLDDDQRILLSGDSVVGPSSQDEIIPMSESVLPRRIRDLRAMLGLTLEQVAQQVGVGRSTIRKWETGMIENMRRDKIAKLAAALHTTPGYLMGWEDTPAAPLTIKTPAADFTAEETELVRKFRCLDERGQSAVLNVLEHEYASLPGEKADPAPKQA